MLGLRLSAILSISSSLISGEFDVVIGYHLGTHGRSSRPCCFFCKSPRLTIAQRLGGYAIMVLIGFIMNVGRVSADVSAGRISSTKLG